MALSQVINKKGDQKFTDDDMLLSRMLAQQCGVFLKRAKVLNAAALESLHASVS